MKPPSRRLRRLSEDEIDLWRTVAETVERRAGSSLPEHLGAPLPLPIEPSPRIVLSRASPEPQGPKPPPLAPLERRLKQKLSRGRMTADAAIDLHGFRQDEAYGALLHFLLRTQRQGATVVIVVTGKGGRPGGALEPGGIGVLRRAVPLWLAMPAFRAVVVGFEEAARHHGGAGALYVRLRRHRATIS